MALDEVRDSEDAGARRRRDCELLVGRGTDRVPVNVDLHCVETRRHRTDENRRAGIFRARDPHQRGQPGGDRYRDG